MDKRIRASRRSNLNRAEKYYKYLKPGALARLRDSRISARSPWMSLQSQIYVSRDSFHPESPPSDGSDTYVSLNETFPFLIPPAYGPRFPQRKKVLASKTVWTHSPSQTRPSPPSPSDSVVDVFGSDAVAAH